jgi:hypothetical protein
MRKRLTFAMIAAVVAAAAVSASALAVVGPAPDGNTQEATISFKPTKLGKKVATPVTLAVTTKTGTVSEPNGKPVPVTQAILDFDKGAAVFAKGYPTCPVSELENVSTEIALEKCKKAKIGGGAATVLLPSARGVTVENTTVTAFNGVPQGGSPVVLLHVYGAVPIQTTQVLTGVVTKFGKEGYGPRLTVAVPLIAGGAGALTDFQVSVFKNFNYKGKKRSYVSSTCATKRLKGRAQFIYKDGQSLTVEGTQKCSQKPEPKKKKKKRKGKR